MARILGVGVAVLDVINEVDEYPPENSEIRALSQCLRRGGNATNSLVILSQLGHRCDWAGVLANDSSRRIIDQDLARYGIGSDFCRVLETGRQPTSYITLNRRNGSRSIVHFRDLPEYGSEDFAHVPTNRFDWIHFEGRNVDETRRMLQRMKNTGQRFSLEIEKPRPDIETLTTVAPVILYSRDYARAHGYADAKSFIESRAHIAGQTLSCTWGEQGAVLRDAQGRVSVSPAFAPAQVVDTLGAGDCFNAGLIHGLVSDWPATRCLAFACQLAGKKCGQPGLDGLVDRS